MPDRRGRAGDCPLIEAYVGTTPAFYLDLTCDMFKVETNQAAIPLNGGY